MRQNTGRSVNRDGIIIGHRFDRDSSLGKSELDSDKPVVVDP